MRDFKGAVKDFESLYNLTPNFIDAPWGEDIDFVRGEAFYGLKEYQKAIAHFNKSIENQGEEWVDIQSYVYLGICESNLGRFDKAIYFYKRAINRSEYACEAHFGLAQVYKKIGETEKAKEHISKAEEYFKYKRNDPYNEFLNEIYRKDILTFKNNLEA